MNNLQLAVQLFLQLAVILLFCRLVGAVAARFGQPQVVAEMIAGVCLGPSLFGLIWPRRSTGFFRGTKRRNSATPRATCFRCRSWGWRSICSWSGWSSVWTSCAGGCGAAWRCRWQAWWRRLSWGRGWRGCCSATRTCSLHGPRCSRDVVPGCFDVHHGVSDAGTDHPLQETGRDHDGHSGARGRGHRRRDGVVPARGGARQL